MFAVACAESGEWPANVILVLDEDRRVYNKIRKLFREGPSVLYSHKPDEAMAILEDQPVGVLLCNETLQDENGLLFMARTTRCFPLLQPVLMCAGLNEELMAIAINDVGVIKYLKKPVDKSQVKETLLSALAYHREAVETARLKESYRIAIKEMHGIPHIARRARKAVRILLHNSSDLTAFAGATIAVMTGLFFILGITALVLLYLLKMLLGIDLFSAEHLSDILLTR
jgi:DNA-binding NtrC family response regulator